jgi:multidrug efflux system membrane fusion protein
VQQNVNGLMTAQALDRTRSSVLDTGRFYSLDNQIDVTTGTVKAKARFENAKLALFPSQFVNVRINVQTIHDAVVVPVSALRHGNNNDYVWILNADHTVTMRAVKAGQATVDRVQVASGLQAGEKVITEGADRLREGSRVILPGESPGAARGGASGARGGGSGAHRGASATAPAPAPASASANAPPKTTAGAPPAAAGPTAEQRQRMLDAVKDDPEQLARRQKFLDAIDKGDPQALERWRSMQQRRQQGGGQQ